MTYEVDVFFVIPKGTASEDECDQEMLQAFSHCSLHSGSGINAQWLTEDECFGRTNFGKKDVYVLQEFEGDIFDKLCKTKALVVGARCLSCCLTSATPIPSGPHPVYTVAMSGLVVTVSGFTKEIKEKIRTKVQWMGGKYENALNSTSTHLIADTIFSDKYNCAAASDIPIMNVEWVDAVWKASLERNVSGGDEIFLKEHKLPSFFGAVVTSTGFSKKEKEKIMKLIERSGGSFKGAFESMATDIVVVSNSGIGSEKHKAGVEHGKLCVNMNWVFDSFHAGKALPASQYAVYENKTSSPIGNGKLPDMSINVSTIANVRNPATTSVDDTCCITLPNESNKTTSKKPQDTLSSAQKSGKGSRICPIAKELGQLVDGLDMKEVRLAGAILEDCALYVYGVTASRRDKLHRIIDRCGGMRYSSCHDQVTHAVCGDPSKGPVGREDMPKAIHITTKWIVDSIRAKKFLDETQYMVVESSSDKCESATKNTQSQQKQRQLQDSPMSKRNLQLLQTNEDDSTASGVVNRPPVPLFQLDDIVQHYREQSQLAVGDSEDALAQYFKQGGTTLTKEAKEDSVDSNVTLRRDRSVRPNPEASESVSHIRVKDGGDRTVVDHAGPTDASTMTEGFEDVADLFNGLIFEFQGIEESSAAELVINITESGGKVVEIGENEETSNPDVTYVIVPMDYDEDEVVNKQAHIINTFWLDDCLTQKKIVDIEYFHRPVRVAANACPLQGLTIGISNYMGVERSFIDELAQLLGATTQNTFCRRNAGGNKASTHLICPTPEGNKYIGAVKWGLPAVKSEWLLECAQGGKRVREGPYLVGETKEPDYDYEEDESQLVNLTVNAEQNMSVTCAPMAENKENISSHFDNGPEKSLVEADVHVDGDALSVRVEDLTHNEDAPVQKVNEVLDQESNKRKSVASDSFSNIKINTPRGKAKLSLGPSTEMSPISRILARARLPDSQETPKRVSELCKEAKQSNDTLRTPPLDNALSTPNLAVFSPTSRRRLQAIKRGEMPSDTIKTPRNPFETSSVPTPDSPFGAILRPDTGHMSADSKKKLQRFINQLPELQKTDKNKETPISELKNNFFSRFDKDKDYPVAAKQLNMSDADETPPAKQRKLTHSPDKTIENQLKQLTSLVTAANTTNSTPRGKKSLVPIDIDMDIPGCDDDRQTRDANHGIDSQICTVGWDDVSQATSKIPNKVPEKKFNFIISMNVQNREEISSAIQSLGSSVCESGEWDATITHVLHGKPSRSEKVLAAIGAGLWVLHPSYIEKCKEQGKFINEEEYEWGNPKAVSLPKLESAGDCVVAAAAYRWRLACSQGQPSAFHDMRFLLYVPASRKLPLTKVIVSGGGTVLDASSPFSGEHHATICIAENSLLPFSPEDLNYLVDRKIPVCAPSYISKKLLEEKPLDVTGYIYPFYAKRLKEKFGD